MSQCAGCGASLPAGATKCEKCGTPVDAPQRMNAGAPRSAPVQQTTSASPVVARSVAQSPAARRPTAARPRPRRWRKILGIIVGIWIVLAAIGALVNRSSSSSSSASTGDASASASATNAAVVSTGSPASRRVEGSLAGSGSSVSSDVASTAAPSSGGEAVRGAENGALDASGLANLQASDAGKVMADAAGGDWQGVEQDVVSIAARNTVARGDVAASRQANAKGLTLMSSGDADGAASAFRVAIQQDPANVEARNNLAYALLKNGDVSASVNQIVSVLEQAPDRSDAWANLGQDLAASDVEDAVTATTLAAYFSRNRPHTLLWLQGIASANSGTPWGEVASKVAASMGQLPPRGATVTSTPAPESAQPQASTLGAPGAVPSAALRIVGNGEDAFARRDFSTAIADAKAALAVNPDYPRALKLLNSAQQAQQKALNSISIH